jgi:endonuclease YncB( thermonuclease family)
MKTFVVIILLALASVSVQAQRTFHGTVQRVKDGDTFVVLKRTTLVTCRIPGGDAPEKAQAFGQGSKEQLTTILTGKRVFIVNFGKDKFGREVCQAFLDKQDIMLAQIVIGLAWYEAGYAKKLSKAEQSLYLKAHEFAKAARLGLWAGENPIRPQDWRMQQKSTPGK